MYNKSMNIFKDLSFKKVYPFILVIGGIIGILASSILTIEKIKIAQNPNYVPSCSISPVVACSPVIGSWQGKAFGFPNPFIGIFGFACVLTVGMTLLAGATIKKRWYWLTFQLGCLFGLLFISWLISQSLYDIGKLCMYCMIVWSVTIPIFWTTLAYNINNKHLSIKPKIDKFLFNNFGKLIAISYLIVIVMILTRFSDYFYSLI